jgi:nucleoside-diphosphate-sugar epimerase
MLVALTGASGFIGSYTARALHRAGHTVRALVRPTSRREHIADVVAEWREGDAADPQAIGGLVAGVEVVIHNAVDWDALERSPVTHFERNVLGSLRLLEASRQAGAGQFVFVSSVAVHHEVLPDRAFDEAHPTWPSSIYGAYKASVEPFLKAYHHTYGLNASAWRPAAVYGVDPNLTKSQWYGLIDQARRGEGTINTPAGGKITHVQDVADALTLAVGDASVAGQFYTLVDRHMYWQQAAEFAKEISGSGATIVDRRGAGPRNTFDTPQPVVVRRRARNATRAATAAWTAVRCLRGRAARPSSARACVVRRRRGPLGQKGAIERRPITTFRLVTAATQCRASGKRSSDAAGRPTTML